MRCPYCHGLNAERAAFCAHCGRDLTQPPRTTPTAQSVQPPSSTRASQSYPQQQPSPYAQRTPASSVPPTSVAQPQPARPPQARSTTSPPSPTARATANASMPRPAQVTRTPEPVKAPEPPAQFPPRTLEQLQALEQGALSYSIIHEAIGDGRKRIVRITYHACSAWQQVATLLKAFKEQQSDTFDTLIVQGVISNTLLPYTFNNGQLRFDRNVRLGSQLINRYIIETGTGFENDAVRIVLQNVGT